MKKELLLIGLFIVLLFIGCNESSAKGVLKDYTFVTVDGKSINFNNLKGVLIVINIGGHW